MQLVIYLNRQDLMNAIDATLINSQNTLNAFSRHFAQIKTELNMKINKIKKLYELKKRICRK